jgi:hypothetical protein
MKKIIITFIYLSIITAFTACKEDPPNNQEDPNNPNDETIFVSKTAANRNVLLEISRVLIVFFVRMVIR